MRRFILHLLVAFIAFVVGVTAANLFGWRFGHQRHGHRFKMAYAERSARPGPPAADRSCPFSRTLSELPAPAEMPDAPSAPDAPPAPADLTEVKQLRVVTQPDGTKQVIAPRAGELKKY